MPPRKKRVVITPPTAEDRPTRPAHRQTAKPPAPAVGRFAYNRRGVHRRTREQLVVLDPLELDVARLWQPAAVAAGTQTCGRASSGDDSCPLDKDATRHVHAGAGTFADGKNNYHALTTRPRARQQQGLTRPTRVAAIKRPPLRTARGSGAVPTTRPRGARSRSPAAVRRAAVYVAHAAGLTHRDEPAAPPKRRAADDQAPRTDVRRGTSAPQQEEHGQHARGHALGAPDRPWLRLTLHAELAL